MARRMAETSVSPLLIRPLWAALASHPAAQQQLLEEAGIGVAALEDPDGRVTGSQFARAWDALLRLSGDRQIALAIAQGIPPGAFGVVEYLCRAAPDLERALTQWCRFLNLLNDGVRVELLAGPSPALAVVSEHAVRAPASHELCFAVLVRHARALCGPSFRVTRVEFQHAPPGNEERYRELFGAPVQFSAERTALHLPVEILKLPISTADPQLAAILERHGVLMAEQVPQPSLLAQVRALVREGLSRDAAAIELVARRLAMTPRSLQRRLSEEGTTFQDVREEVRRELAARYLKDGLSLAEISFLLGFSEPSAFFRAFRRWTGRTPQQVRKDGARAAVGPAAG